jgi:hypothetical protein
MLLVIPIVLLLVLAIGEMVGGDMSGAQHIVMAAPLILVLLVAWRSPRVAGTLLLAMGVLLLMAWIALITSRGVHGTEILGYAVAGLLIFVPPLAAGWLLRRAERPSTS